MFERLPFPVPEHAKVFEPPIWHWDEKSHLSTAEFPTELLPEVLQPVVKELKGVPLLFEFPGRTFYDWHLDRLRLCALNWEVSGKGTLLFGDKEEKRITDIQTAPYGGHALLLNTQRWHAVWNHEKRRVLSVGFNKHLYQVVLSTINTALQRSTR